jgi:hypothetical protein
MWKKNLCAIPDKVAVMEVAQGIKITLACDVMYVEFSFALVMVQISCVDADANSVTESYI